MMSFQKKNPELFQMEWRKEPLDLSVSVIIPCHHTDFYLVKNLLKIYGMQTVLPLEVIVSLSGLKLMSSKGRKKVRATQEWSRSSESGLGFPVKWVTHQGNRLPGGNKNAAAELAVGDIILVQDSDDIPHIQRVEIVKWWFDHCDINHLGHTFTRRYENRMITAKEYQKMKYNNIRFNDIGKMKGYRRLPELMGKMPKKIRVKITNGEVALLRSVFEKHQWNPKMARAEDTSFNRLIERKYMKSINLVDRLVIYNRVKQVKKKK